MSLVEILSAVKAELANSKGFPLEERRARIKNAVLSLIQEATPVLSYQDLQRVLNRAGEVW